jgi:hypothetical protein
MDDLLFQGRGGATVIRLIMLCHDARFARRQCAGIPAGGDSLRPGSADTSLIFAIANPDAGLHLSVTEFS